MVAERLLVGRISAITEAMALYTNQYRIKKILSMDQIGKILPTTPHTSNNDLWR